MKYNTAIETGLAIIPLLEDPEIVFSEEQIKEFQEFVNVILSHEDIDDDDEQSQDAFKALNALRKITKKY